jgi:hypothetical protein
MSQLMLMQLVVIDHSIMHEHLLLPKLRAATAADTASAGGNETYKRNTSRSTRAAYSMRVSHDAWATHNLR